MDICKQLEKVIANACNIYAKDGKYVFATEGSETVHVFTPHDLALLDPRLPEVTEYLVERYTVNHVMAIRITLDHWRDPGKPVRYNNFTRLRGVEKIYRTQDVDGQATYRIRTVSYSVDEISDKLECTGRATLNTWHTDQTDWFEEHYPGLIARLEALLAMGADPEEASFLALQDTHAPEESVTLNAVTFE